MKKIIKFFVILILFFVCILLYAKYVGTMGFITKEYTLFHENLPKSFDGLKVIHFSDLHYKRFIDENKVNTIVDEINLINPDIVLFTGDLIDKDTPIDDSDYIFLANAFKRINSKYGKYAIIGNHDYDNLDKVIKIYNEGNFKYLEDKEEVIMNRDGDTISIIGINSEIMESINIDNSYYKIFMVHRPDVSDQIMDKYSADLILAGHSHNGQIRLPYIGAVYTPIGAKKYYDEYYNVNNTDIYISSGIGVSNVNMRLFNKPSINFYRINKK